LNGLTNGKPEAAATCRFHSFAGEGFVVVPMI